MRLAGRWNWWAPRPLARLHSKIGLSDTYPALDHDSPLHRSLRSGGSSIREAPSVLERGSSRERSSRRGHESVKS
jgi:hypothetical protein